MSTVASVPILCSKYQRLPHLHSVSLPCIGHLPNSVIRMSAGVVVLRHSECSLFPHYPKQASVLIYQILNP